MTNTPAALISTAQPQTVALFISDLHLQESMPATMAAFFLFLQTQARHTQQLYLLGDIFEYWAGDDDLTAFNLEVIKAIRAVNENGVKLFWIAGNRDFLVGSLFAQMAGMHLLSDPFVTHIAGKAIVLTHGDILCTDDTAYLKFRSQVRQVEWQNQFLALPLTQRKAIIANLRQGSREAQREKADYIMDVNDNAVHALYTSTQTDIMIHGHTHRPAKHIVIKDSHPYVRYVLSDWECDATPARGGWMSIQENGILSQHGLDGSINQAL